MLITGIELRSSGSVASTFFKGAITLALHKHWWHLRFTWNLIGWCHSLFPSVVYGISSYMKLRLCVGVPCALQISCCEVLAWCPRSSDIISWCGPFFQSGDVVKTYNEQDFSVAQSSSYMHRHVSALFILFSVRSDCGHWSVSGLWPEDHLYLGRAMNVNSTCFMHVRAHTHTHTHTHSWTHALVCAQTHKIKL